jgi:hypothetical protein
MRPGDAVETWRRPVQGGRTIRLLPPEAKALRPGEVNLSNRGTLVPTASTQLRSVTRTMVVYKVPPTCGPITTTTGTPHHIVLERPLRSTTYRSWGHSGKPGRCRTGEPGNSKAVWGTGVEDTPQQDRFPGEARFGVAWYRGGHLTAALPPVPVKAFQDLPSGQTVPPEGNSAQEKMFFSRDSAILWTWKFGMPCGHRRPPAPAGPLRLCKRRDPKSEIDVMPLDSSRLGVVGQPSHESARGPRNLGRCPIRDSRDGRLDGGLGGRVARSSNGGTRTSRAARPPRQGPAFTRVLGRRYRPEACSYPRTRSPSPSTNGNCSPRHWDSRHSYR